MDHKHYIGDGPEAQALIDECHARKQAADDAVLDFQKKHGFQNGWRRGAEFGGPATEKEMDTAEARSRGLKFHCRIDEDTYAYKPHLGTALGKQMDKEIAEINKTSAFDASKHIIKATGMYRMMGGAHAGSRTGMALYFSTAGFAQGKIVVKVPAGPGRDGQDPMPVPPPWLREAKESEVLALYGK